MNADQEAAVRAVALETRARHDPRTVSDEAIVEALTATWNEHDELTVGDVAEAAAIARRALAKARLARRRGLRRVK